MDGGEIVGQSRGVTNGMSSRADPNRCFRVMSDDVRREQALVRAGRRLRAVPKGSLSQREAPQYISAVQRTAWRCRSYGTTVWPGVP